MGLFSKTQPQVLTAEQGAAQAGQYLTQALDPLVESYGYQSQENQVLDIMKGVDIEDIDSFNAAYKKILGINPEAAAEFKSQVLPMMKTTMDIRGLQNTPALEAEWNYGETGKSFKRGYAKKHLGIKDEAVLAGINSEEDLIAAIESFSGGLDTSDGRAKYAKVLKQYENAKKLAKSTFLGKKYRRDPLGTDVTGLDLTSPPAPPVEEQFPDAAATKAKRLADATAAVMGGAGTYEDKVTAQTVGYAGTPNVTQVNPEDTGFWREKQEYKAKQDVMIQVSSARVKAAPVAFFGDLTLTPAEVKQDKINREIQEWTEMALAPGGYFALNPTEVPAYVNDVQAFYKNLPAKDKLKAKRAAKAKEKAEKEANKGK